MEFSTETYLEGLAKLWGISDKKISGYWNDLLEDTEFLNEINRNIVKVPAFGGKQFSHPGEMRVYRCLVYLATRAFRPRTFVETGVQNGMSSAFILLGMHHNEHGHLYSIDLPPLDNRILEQGTNPLPPEKSPGWIIPKYLRERHSLHLGAAEELLPRILFLNQDVDVFLHDSDHSYTHIMFEVCLAWRYLVPGGLVMVDNIEQNDAFSDFVAATGGPSMVVSTFKGEDRTWQHGLTMKALS
jgi:predicted O-methyltransferase YrrM